MSVIQITNCHLQIWACELCSLGGVGRNKLDEHLLLYHSSTGRNISCECIARNTDLLDHIDRTHVIKLFACNLCECHFQSLTFAIEHASQHFLGNNFFESDSDNKSE